MTATAVAQKQTLADHLSELRNRLAVSLLVFICGGTVGYVYRSKLITLLRQPLGESLYYTTPAGGFNFVMKISFMVGLAVAIPVLLYNAVKFVQPAVGAKLKNKHIYTVAAIAFLLTASGAAFAFLSVVPMSLHFFKSFRDSNVNTIISANEYLGFVANCVITFMLIFQVPLIVMFIDKIKKISIRRMFKYEKYVVVGSLVVALILPFTYDPLTQFLVAVPIIALYNVSIILVGIVHWRTKKKRSVQARKISNKRPQAAPYPRQPHVITPKVSTQKSVVKTHPGRGKSIEGIIHQRPSNTNRPNTSNHKK